MTEDKNNESIAFQAEVQQLLNLVIHSLYSEREVFLRELISNASDACGRLRFEALTNQKMRKDGDEPTIEIEIHKRAKTITIRDNGIGMTHDEVVENIGTIARSGTKKFVEALSGEESKDTRLIGQFGVGFYSAFMVAEHVLVRTRKAGQPAKSGVVWESNGVDGFTIDSETIKQSGTEIKITLRKDAKEFLEIDRVREVIKKYSDHIGLPVKLRETGKKEEQEWETVNKASALWTRARRDITEEEYKNFYSTLSFDPDDPLVRLHARVEGRLEYTALLYIPSRAPFDMWDRDTRRGIKLYVRRIFVMDDAEHLVPAYLRFVRGVIDSDDLPLNVSREFLQKNPQIDKIKSGVVRKLLGELKKLAKSKGDKYQTFWNEFGKVFKEGMIEGRDNQNSIAELLRFATTKSEGHEQTVSLEEYVSRMTENQKAIYYVTAENHASAKGSPHLEVFRKHDIEVLLLSDPVDEWVVMHLHEYAEKPLKSIAKGDLDLEGFDEPEFEDEAILPLVEKFKEVLSEKATDVRTTSRLTDSPACLVANEYDLGSNMARLLKATGQTAPVMRPVLEINPGHPLIQNLAGKDQELEDWAHVLFDQAALSEGTPLEDPQEYIRRVNSLLTASASSEESVIITP